MGPEQSKQQKRKSEACICYATGPSVNLEGAAVTCRAQRPSIVWDKVLMTGAEAVCVDGR